MSDIDQKVEDWHNGDGEGQELHEYFGMSMQNNASQSHENCLNVMKIL